MQFGNTLDFLLEMENFWSRIKKRDVVHCKLCIKTIKYSGNTSNLRFHLREHHKSVFISLPKTESIVEKQKDVHQSTITQAIASSQPIPQSSTKWNKLTDSVLYFLSKDMQPLDTIDDKGFRHLLYTFEPRYVPPSRKTITTKHFPQLYQSLKERISALVHSATTVALTTDIWTSRANHGYTGLTIHHISKDFDLNHHLLETKEFPESHTAVNVANELTTILAEWKIEESKVAAISTDNGMNITAADRNLGWTHLPCFSHILQLSVEKVLKLPRVVKAIARCKRIVTHFNHSSKSSHLLKEKQSNHGHKQHSLIQDVITRWNSAHYMIKRMLEQQQPLCATLLELHKGDLWPTDTELKTLEGFVMVMEPLVEITEAIGADKWVTISTLRPILHKLLETHLYLPLMIMIW